MPGRKKKSESEPRPGILLDRTFARNLRRWRKKRGYSQERLAELAELHRTEVGLLENAKREPKYNVIFRLAGALGIPPGELYDGATFVPAESEQGRYVYDEPESDSN
jgi:transcriptional regulator with XRE-family HTH domain